MDRKYLSPPFDMSEYIFGKRFVLGGVSFDEEDEAPETEESRKIFPASPRQETSTKIEKNKLKESP